MNRVAAKVYPRWLRVVAVVVGFVGLPFGWLVVVGLSVDPRTDESVVEGVLSLGMGLVFAAGMVLVSWVGHLTDAPRRLSPGERHAKPVFGRLARVLIGVVGLGFGLLFVIAGGVMLGKAGWSAAAAVTAAVLVAFVVTIIGSAALVSAGNISAADSDNRRAHGGHFAASLVAGMRVGLWVCAGTVGLAVVGVFGWGLWLLMGVIAGWLHVWLGVPEEAGRVIGLVLILAAWYGPISVAFSIHERRRRERPRAPDGHAYVEPVSFGSRPDDPIHPEDVESIVGLSVTRVVRTVEEPYDPPDAGPLAPVWGVLFELSEDTHLTCEVADLGDASGVTADRAGHVKAYQRVDVVDGVGDDAMAVVDAEDHEFLWAQLGDRWTVEVYGSAYLPRSIRIAAARTVIDRLRQRRRVGSRPARDAGDDGTVARRSGSRPHDPLHPSDVETVTGRSVTQVVRDYETADDPADTAVSDGFWHLRFILAAAPRKDEVTCRAVALNDDAALLDAERAAWSALGDVRAIAGLGDEAFAVHDRHRKRATIWTRVDTAWTVQIQTTRGVSKARRIQLADTAVHRLRERSTRN